MDDTADIKVWNNIDETWHTPRVEVDLRDQGRFLYRMESKDGKHGFDHVGCYDRVRRHELIDYTLTDGRKSTIEFLIDGDQTVVSESFEPEKETPHDEQFKFVSKILASFRSYAESFV